MKEEIEKKHRRSVAEIREEHKKFIELYQRGLTPFEIMRKISISMAQYKKHFAEAIDEEQITRSTHKYGTCFGKHLPEKICMQLQATKEDIIRFEVTDKGVLLSKADI